MADDHDAVLSRVRADVEASGDAIDWQARAEAAGATLAEVRRVAANFLAHYGNNPSASFKVAGDLAHGVLQVIDRGKGGSEEEGRPRITVDLNVRVRKHETYSGFEDVAGADPASLRLGDRVLAVEVEDRICSDAIVTAVDPERHLVYLVPDWRGWRDDPAVAGYSATCTGCGGPYAGEETGSYLFTSREGLERRMGADGWQSDPVLCPACQPEHAS